MDISDDTAPELSMDRLKVLTAIAQSLLAGRPMFGCTGRVR